MSTMELFGVRYVSREFLCEATGCSSFMLKTAEAQGLPRMRFGKRIWYPEDEVRRWFEQRIERAGERVAA